MLYQLKTLNHNANQTTRLNTQQTF
uniref:Uncharacterized protein n=1 Tax=Arundo donax TaxID=35708 RepID=A0A0A9CQ76_ARUDO